VAPAVRPAARRDRVLLPRRGRPGAARVRTMRSSSERS
jgi:hypothetical protein